MASVMWGDHCALPGKGWGMGSSKGGATMSNTASRLIMEA